MNAPMATAPNAAVPLISRRKLTRDELATARGHAAGIICVAPSGKVLLLRRGDHEPNFAGHWALPGGGAETNETPARAARREAKEEMGYSVKGPLVLLDQKVTPTGMVFHTFMHAAEDEFIPKLNQEHTGYAWAPLHALPRPMHPAVEGVLHRNVGVASDMKPEDWRHLISGLLEFFEEEAEEPEHAEDSRHLTGDEQKLLGEALRKSVKVIAQDESVKMPDVDGRLHVIGVNICMESVSPYKGQEIPGWQELGLKADEIYQVYRPGSELSRAETIASANGIPLLRKHVATSAEDHKFWDTIGSTGTTARWESPFIINDLAVWPADDIEGIENKTKSSLSPGYRYSPVLERGEFNGKRYDIKMRNIIFNHLAVVVEGRQGPDIVIDTAEELQWTAIERAILGLRP